MRFNIDGIWYDAATYKEAREMHEKAKASHPKASQAFTPNVPKPAVVQHQQTGFKHQVGVNPSAAVTHQKPLVTPPPAFSLPKKAAPPPMPVVAKASSPSADSFELVVYRGEKKAWWPAPEKRLVSGMTLYDAWNTLPKVNSMKDLWEHLRKFMQETSFGNVGAFCQYLRATSRNYALATAWTEQGSFTSDYNYVIKIPNARTFLWGPKLSLGAPAKFKKPKDVSAPFLVLNADTVEDSTILGIGHEAGTFEITFMHDLRLSYIASCNNKAVETTPVDQWTIDERARLGKLVRNVWTGWL